MKCKDCLLREKRIVFSLVLLLLGNTITAQIYNWNNVAIGGGGFVSGIITSRTQKNMMYTRTDVGGAYRWESVNGKWIPLTDWVSENETGYLGVESIALDPQDNSKLYMFCGTNYFNGGKTVILRSTDSGNSFTITDVSNQFKASGNSNGRQNGERLAVDPNLGTILFCGTRSNGLFKSKDSGATWTNVSTLGNATPNTNGINFVVFDSSTGTKGNATQTILFGVSQTNNNLYISTNAGMSFGAITGAPTGLMPQRAVLAKDRTLYITYADKEGPSNASVGQIWKYNLVTAKWTNITPLATTYPYSGISVDPKNPARLIASTINTYKPQNTNVYGDKFYLSIDGGASWRDLVGNGFTLDPNGCTWIAGQSIHWAGCIEFNPFNSSQAFVTSGNGMFVCDDIDALKTTWKFNAIGVEETVPRDIVSIANGPLISVISDYDGFRHNDVTQYAPIHSPRMGSTTGIAYAAGNTNTLLRVGNNMYYSTNQGISWSQCSAKGKAGKVAISSDGKTFLHCPGGSDTTYRSNKDGNSWTISNGLKIADAVPVADPVNASKFYAYNNVNGSMMVSTDSGSSFFTSGNAGSGGSRIIRSVLGYEGHLWVALINNGLARSTNSGQSFTKMNGVTLCRAVGLGKAAQEKNYPTLFIWGIVNGVIGVHISTDQGVSWTRINDDAHEYGGLANGQLVIGDWNVFGRVYMSTAGRGIAYGEPTSQIPTSLGEISMVNQLEEDVICFPNPSTNYFSLKSNGLFNYSIFDIIGNEVENGKGENILQLGGQLNAGMYLLKFESSTTKKTFKICKK